MISEFYSQLVSNELITALKILYSTSFVWLPIILIAIFIRAWIDYKRAVFFLKQGSILLEIRLPKEINKSPAAMEVALMTFIQTQGEATFIDKYIKGNTRPWFSLEMVSIEGNVKFFIWTWPGARKGIESQIYAQYPGVEILEVPDYTTDVIFDPEKINLWGCNFTLTKADPYPIKTYIDYGLDKDPKEEFKIDPMTPVLEYLGSLTAGESAWFQIIIRAHGKNKRKKGTLFETTDSWKDEAKKEVDKILEGLKPKDGEVKFGRFATKGEETKITALERSVSKHSFDCGIRGIYLADKDVFDPSNIGGIVGSFKQYSSGELNGFKPFGGLIGFNYPWQDFKDIRKNKAKKWILDAYKRRSYFFPPYKRKAFVLNVEELATIYHFPGEVVSTPTLDRVSSKKSEPPANLPV